MRSADLLLLTLTKFAFAISPTTTMRLPDLPDELICLICEALEPPHRPRLLGVCRRWRVILERSVYSELDLTSRQIRPFVAAVEDKPHIFSQVKSLRLSEMCHDWGHSRKQLKYLGWVHERVEELWPRQISKFENREWHKGIQYRDEDIWGALLLSMLPELRNLELELHDVESGLWDLFSLAASPDGRGHALLQKLESIVFTTPPPSTRCSSPDLSPFFWLPAMRRVEVPGMLDDRKRMTLEAGELQPPETSTVEVIRLDFVWHRPIFLSGFIECCENLKEFYFASHIGHEAVAPRDWELRKEVFTPLCSQKESLEVLELNYKGLSREGMIDLDDERTEHPGQWYDRWFGSLMDFQCLKHLSMRAANLLDIIHDESGPRLGTSLLDTIPRCLESLHISFTSDAEHDVAYTAVTELVNANNGFPALKNVVIDYELYQ